MEVTTDKVTKNTEKKTVVEGYSKPHLKGEVDVSSEFSIQAVDQYLKRTLSALYALDVILFYLGSDDLADKANKKANERIESIIALFHKRKDEVLDLHPECDIDIVNYSNHRKGAYKVYSPLSVKYLEMVQAMDLAIKTVDAVWLSCKIDSAYRNQLVKKFSRMLSNVSAEMRNLAKNAKKVAEDHGKARVVAENMASNNIAVDEKTGEFDADIGLDE